MTGRNRSLAVRALGNERAEKKPVNEQKHFHPRSPRVLAFEQSFQHGVRIARRDGFQEFRGRDTAMEVEEAGGSNTRVSSASNVKRMEIAPICRWRLHVREGCDKFRVIASADFSYAFFLEARQLDKLGPRVHCSSR